MASLEHERRFDWRTAQVVDRVINYLSMDGRVANAHHYMKKHLVPEAVQARVLSNTAVIRHKSLLHFRRNIGRMDEIEVAR